MSPSCKQRTRQIVLLLPLWPDLSLLLKRMSCREERREEGARESECVHVFASPCVSFLMTEQSVGHVSEVQGERLMRLHNEKRARKRKAAAARKILEIKRWSAKKCSSLIVCGRRAHFHFPSLPLCLSSSLFHSLHRHRRRLRRRQ